MSMRTTFSIVVGAVAITACSSASTPGTSGTGTSAPPPAATPAPTPPHVTAACFVTSVADGELKTTAKTCPMSTYVCTDFTSTANAPLPAPVDTILLGSSPAEPVSNCGDTTACQQQTLKIDSAHPGSASHFAIRPDPSSPANIYRVADLTGIVDTGVPSDPASVSAQFMFLSTPDMPYATGPSHTLSDGTVVKENAQTDLIFGGDQYGGCGGVNGGGC